MTRYDRIRTARLLRLTLISAAVSSCFASGAAIANPTGANVVRGTAAIHQAGNLLQITNSPNTIINWQSFSIGSGEITRFLQQSSSSAVLNRVIAQNPSSILGALQSNGRVFLINPNGILFGAGAQVDVAGLVASTLNMSDGDFLAGRMRFTDGMGKSVINEGGITTPAGGHVYLVGPGVTNSGIITSPQGEVVLAAGNSVELVNPGTPNLRVEITAPDNQALNLGQIFADSGRVGIYGGLINQSGVIQANTAVATEDGRIVLKATNSAHLAAGSVTTATGPLEIEAGGNVTVSGNVSSGPQTITAGGGLIVQGSAAGTAQLTASGGQTINAAFVEVTAQEGGAQIFNGFTGDQIITTTGANAGGESLAIRNLGGTGVPASIMQNSSGRQVVDVSGKLTVEGGSAPAGQPAGVIFLGIGTGGQQIVSAESIRLQGGSGGNSNSAFISAFSGPQEVIAGAGGITLIGGSSGTTNTASIGVSNSSQQTISSAGGLTLIGGAAGTSNFASIRQGAAGGPQNVTVNGGGITLQGGPGGTSNFAQIAQSNPGVSQTITVNGGDIALLGGAGGTNNGAFLLGPSQLITATGDVTLSGGSGSGNSPRIGGPSASGGVPELATDLTLSAGGDVVLTGGSAANTGALIGNTGAAPLQPTNIAINAGGDVILNGGTGTAGAAARIGSSTNAPAAGGDISISAGESIQLNSATAAARIRTLGNVTLQAGTTISEGPNSLIEANALTTTSNAGTSLTGPNQVASFNAATAGDVVFNNTSPLLTVTGVHQLPSGALAIRQAGDLTVTGSMSSGPQTIEATGDISILASNSTAVSANGMQTVSAGGTLSLVGATSGTNSFARLRATEGQDISATDIVIIGGGGTGNFAEILQTGAGAGQTINASSISLTGGDGGSSNAARIQNNGTAPQKIAGSPVITITGGTGGIVDQGNSASIFSTGPQDITAGSIAITAGGAGFNNFAGINAPVQVIAVQGDLTLDGGASASGPLRDGAARIGGRPNPATPTNLTLTVGGDVTMNGGSMAFAAPVIGSHFLGDQPTDITMSVRGNVVLNPGTVANASPRIGSPSEAPAGGNISVTAAGDLVLNGALGLQAGVIRTTDSISLRANSIVQGSNSKVAAGSLATNTVNGTSLVGDNQVARFNATNGGMGDIALANSGNLAVTASNSAPGGKITISNLSGELSTSGAIATSGGGSADVALGAVGAVNIAHPVTASGTGNVSLAGGAITVDDTSVSAGGSVVVTGANLDVKGVLSGASIQAGNGFAANLSGDLRVRSDSTGGGFGGWSAILADDGPINISAGNVALEGGGNFGSFATIAGGPVNVATTGDLSVAGGSGFGSFSVLLGSQDIGLTVGGNLRLDAGGGFGSLARVQALDPGSTINIRFPNLSSGGYFVNGVEGRISQGLSGFFTGIRPARLGRTLIVTYGE